MCGITGWIDWNKDLTRHSSILVNMTETLAARGPDAHGTWLTTHCAFGHRRLSIIDPENGAQPMHTHHEDQDYTIVYNGEIYNALELRKELIARGHRFKTRCDTEVVLHAYLEWGDASVEKLNGIFAYGVWDWNRERLFLARDRLGVKPLFYAESDGRLLFGSEPKAILAHPEFEAAVSLEGLNEIFMIGPARTPGHGVFIGMAELKPGYTLSYDRSGSRQTCYWSLISQPHTDNEQETADQVLQLLQDTVERQLVSDVPIGTLLSGGLDSSALTAFAAEHYKKQQQDDLQTFSVDYVDNAQHFQSNEFQPNSDHPWIIRMSEHLGTAHTFYEFTTDELVDALDEAVLARDTPGMADIDASLLLFCREIRLQATVAISGEAADEIFGGYPWFHKAESLAADTFPWSLGASLRDQILAPDVRHALQPMDYLKRRYEEALGEVPHLDGEDAAQRRMREMSYLNISRFMPTLLDRKDRMSMRAGLEVRVPFCDHRLIEYVWNIPWSIKSAGGREKGILRQALQGVLPQDVLERKKSPYPKTHHPAYLSAVKERMREILHDSSSPLLPLIDRDLLQKWSAADSQTSAMPWFGQLMAGPQLFAYLYQVDYWLRHYRIAVRG